MTAMCSSKSRSRRQIMDEFAPKLVLHGRTTAGCLHGDSCVGTPRVLGKLLSTVAAI